MASHSGLQAITIHILLDISRSKCNQTMKLGQLIEYNKILFFKNQTQNEVERLIPDLFSVLKKLYMR